MQFSQLLAPLSLLTLVAANGAGPGALAIIYQNPDYFGYSKTIFPENCKCINLSPPLKNAIRSIKLGEGAHCAFFYGKDCGEVRADYDIDQPDIVNWATTDSIRCSMIDA